MKKIISVLLFTLFLVGCKQEPMIKLSPERQKEVEIKTNQTSVASEANTQLETNNQNTATAQVSSPFDVSQFTPYSQAVVFDNILDFIPNQPNQVKVMVQGENQIVNYMDFVDSQLKMMQIRQESAGEITTIIYRWDTDKIVRTASGGGTLLPVQQLASSQFNESQPFIVLHGPLQVGTLWQADSTTSATISNIYQVANINGVDYQDVIEVSYQSSDQVILYYFAKGVGFVASSQGTADLMTQVQVQQITNETTFAKYVDFYVPTDATDQVTFKAQSHIMSWQTNGQLAQAYTKVFQELGWLNADVVVNSITLTPTSINIDFSPGIVASLNQHAAGEAKLIPAIVTTLSRHFQIETVILTVNQMGLLPDTLPYPNGGAWQVNPAWLIEE